MTAVQRGRQTTGSEDGGENGAKAVRAVAGSGDHDAVSRVSRQPSVSC